MRRPESAIISSSNLPTPVSVCTPHNASNIFHVREIADKAATGELHSGVLLAFVTKSDQVTASTSNKLHAAPGLMRWHTYRHAGDTVVLYPVDGRGVSRPAYGSRAGWFTTRTYVGEIGLL